jgi:hypothetical protein
VLQVLLKIFNIGNFEKLIENVEKTLEIKQSEYNFLLQSKEQEIKFMQEEILNMNEVVETVKRDRIRDQKIMNDFEAENTFLSNKVEELTNKANEVFLKESNNKANIKIEISVSSKIIMITLK